jgi:hypothetical protein
LRHRDNLDQHDFAERRPAFSGFSRAEQTEYRRLKMLHDDVEYWERRAEAEIALAQQAKHQAVVRAHYELASAYLDRIHGAEPRSTGGLFSL